MFIFRALVQSATGDPFGGDYADEVVGSSEVSESSRVSSTIRLAYYKECLCAVKMLLESPILNGVGGGTAAPLVLTRKDHVELISVCIYNNYASTGERNVINCI